MCTRSRIRIGMLLLPLAAGACASAPPRPDEDAREDLRAPAALLGEFESVISARPELLAGSGAYGPLSKKDADLLRAPFAHLVAGLDSLESGASAELLRESGAVLVAAKGFRRGTGPSRELAGIEARLCYVAVLGPRNRLEPRGYFRQASVVVATGTPVWKWPAPRQEGQPEGVFFYATPVDRSFVVISNDRDELHAIARRLGSPGDAPRQAGVRDFGVLAQQALWAYRRYRHDSPDADAAGTADVSQTAEALAFYPYVSARMGVLRLYGPASDAAATAKLDAKGYFAPFRPVAAGVWETTVPFDAEEGTGLGMLAVLYLLGFGSLL